MARTKQNVSPEKLLGRPLTPEAKLILLCLLLGRTPEKFLEALREHPAVLKGTWKGMDRVVVIEGIVVYLENVSGISQDETIMALQNLLNLSPAEEIMYAHEIRSRRAREEGWREGKLEGKLEGELEGKLESEREGELKALRMLVTKQLTERFGPLALDVTARLQAATKTELEEMGLRVLRVSTLDEVLGKLKRKRK